MDNDGKLKTILRDIYRKIRFSLQYKGVKIPSEEEGNNLIFDQIEDALKFSRPLMIGRFGAVESRVIGKYLKNEKTSKKENDNLYKCAGVFPNSDKIRIDFCKEYSNAAKNIDILITWSIANGRYLNKKLCPNAINIPFLSIEPYFYAKPWSRVLKNRKVLIIHPFYDSIIKQYEKREMIFKKNNVLPEFSKFEIIKAIQSNAENPTDYNTWNDALAYMKNEIDKHDFEIAIIGAGAYALPLAAYCKQKGKVSIVMAGATQLLFGIRGARWDKSEKHIPLFNDFWIRPNKDETPRKKNIVEGGSYW